MNEIIFKEEVVPNIHRLRIKAPWIAGKMKPGQFVIVMVDEKSERIPLSVSHWDRQDGSINVYFVETGLSTMKLAMLKPGDSLYSIVGPLGKPSSVEKYGTVVLGGGCYGIAAIYPIAKALKNVGNRVITIIEGHSEYLLYLEEELKMVSDIFLTATSDGSKGIKGWVQDVVTELLKKEKIDRAYFIGCTFMMMNCSKATEPFGVKTMVSLNSIMVDGTGMCGCCRVSVNGETRFACVDGPEFDGHQVDWEELFARKSAYHRDESLIYQRF
jgi:ferredoxin--NADP+ reductase